MSSAPARERGSVNRSKMARTTSALNLRRFVRASVLRVTDPRSCLTSDALGQILKEEVSVNGYDDVRQRVGWFVALGIALIILGCIAIAMAVATTLVSVIIFGWLLLIGGLVQTIHAFWVRPWSGLLLQLLIGILNIVVGFLMVFNPGASALALTLLLAAFFFVGGLFRIILAFRNHFPNRGWALFGGIVNILLGVLIWLQWPASAFWVIGLFIGIDMLITGWWFVILGVAARRLTTGTTTTGHPA